jgi:hypothetical protein
MLVIVLIGIGVVLLLILRTLNSLLRLVKAWQPQLKHEGDLIMSDLSGLRAAVERATTVEQSAIALIKGFVAKLQEANGDQAAINELASQMNSEADALASAVTANTPAESSGTTTGGGVENPAVEPTSSAEVPPSTPETTPETPA